MASSLLIFIQPNVLERNPPLIHIDKEIHGMHHLVTILILCPELLCNSLDNPFLFWLEVMHIVRFSFHALDHHWAIAVLLHLFCIHSQQLLILFTFISHPSYLWRASSHLYFRELPQAWIGCLPYFSYNLNHYCTSNVRTFTGYMNQPHPIFSPLQPLNSVANVLKVARR